MTTQTTRTTKAQTSTGFVLGAATVATGLAAGAFYTFACGVMPGLARSDDRVYVEVMRDINDVIVNPVFLLSFVGALVLVGVAAWQGRRQGAGYRRWVWAGFLAYAVCFLVTVAFNIPLNDELARAVDVGAAREEFEGAWVVWNGVRAVFSTVALGCLVRGLVLYGRLTRS